MAATLDTSTLQTAEAVWLALAALEKGPQRAALLEDSRIRNLILNSGAFVTISAGTIDQAGQTLKEKMAPVSILQTHRLRTLRNTGEVILDGRGTFGGLSERSRPGENLAARIDMPLKKLLEKTVDEYIEEVIKPKLMALVTLRDDLTADAQGKITLVTDIDEIGRTTAARETTEEAAGNLELDIQRFARELGMVRQTMRTIFNESALSKVPLQSVKDDNFVINIWDGDLANPAYAVTPQGYLGSLAKDAFGEMVSQGKKKLSENKVLFENNRDRLKGNEMLGIEDVALFDALKQWGHKNDTGKRDLSQDYRYPHEWLTLWYNAQQLLCATGTPEEKAAVMTQLAQEVQSSVIAEAQNSGTVPHNIDIAGALVQMNGGKAGAAEDLNKFDTDFGLPAGTFIAMHRAAEKILTDAGYQPASPLAGYIPPPPSGTPGPAPA
ncbi:MAG TPA: hypothetical protein VL625_04500 [Patescibacteria group bacterium]|jgi:hypothetical protein|nr:hypothetical protein [Patescibacteria group bacterium]